MPSGEPTFNKIDNLLVSDSCLSILKDLKCALEDYNTKFGKEMLHNAIKKVIALKTVHDTKEK